MKVQHYSPGEGARQEFSCCFSLCPCSHVRHSTNVLLPNSCVLKINPSHLQSHRAKKPLTLTSAALLPWRRFQEETLLLFLTMPWPPCEAQHKSAAPCFLKLAKLTVYSSTHVETGLSYSKAKPKKPRSRGKPFILPCGW